VIARGFAGWRRIAQTAVDKNRTAVDKNRTAVDKNNNECMNNT